MELNKFRLTNILLAVLYLLTAALSVFPQLLTIVFALIIVSCIVLARQRKLYILAPMFLFFNSSILYFSGIAISDIYYAVYVFTRILRRPKLFAKSIPIMIHVFILYAVFVISSFNLTMGIQVILSFLFLIVLLDDTAAEGVLSSFFDWYIVAMISAAAYGICRAFCGEMPSILPMEGIRFMLAFSDPNYAGLFLSIGLYILFFRCGHIEGIVRVLLLVFTTAALLMTVSSTALICNIIVVSILAIDYLTKMQENLYKFIKYLLVAILVAAVLYFIGSNDIPYLSRTLHRFSEKILSMQMGNYSLATTERSDIWREHLRYFANEQNIWGILFGGNYLTDRGFDTAKFSIVSHEVYVDSLICFGIAGTAVYVASILQIIIDKWKKRNNSKEDRIFFTMALIWLIYSFGLSMYPFWAFSFVLFAYVRHGMKESDSVEDTKLHT